MTRHASRGTLRAEVLGIVLVAVVVPLALLGLWLARGTADAGERLLRDRLNTALTLAVRDVGERWVTTRGALLGLADGTTPVLPPSLVNVVRDVVIRDPSGVERSRIVRDAPMDGGRFTVRLPLRSRDGARVGTMEATVVASTVLAPTASPGGRSSPDTPSSTISVSAPSA